MKAPRLRKFLKISFIAFVVLTVIITGGVMWLRTDSGARFVFNQVARLLEGSGLTLTAEEFSGPLPGRIYLRQAAVYDSAGLVATIGEAEVLLNLPALLGGLAHVELIRLEDPQLWKLPEIESQPKDDQGGGFSLPVEVRLDEMRVSGGLVQPQALAAIGWAGPLAFGAAANARLEEAEAWVNLAANVTDGQTLENLLAIDVTMGQAPDGGAALDLKIAVNDGPEGLLAGLINYPGWGGLQLELTGQGPLTDWRGNLTAASQGLADLTASLAFEGASGNLWKDLSAAPHWNGAANLTFRPGPALGANVLDWTGREAALDLAAAAEGPTLGLNLRAANGWEQPLRLVALIGGEGDGAWNIEATAAGLLTGAEEADDTLKLTARLISQPGSLQAERFSLTGQGLELMASGRRATDDGSIDAQGEAAVANDSPWLALGLDLADLPGPLGGNVKLGAEAQWNGASQALSGRVDLSGQAMYWPTPALDHFVGPDLTLAARVEGGGASPYRAVIEKIEGRQFSLEGGGQYQPAENPAQSAINWSLTAQAVDISALLGAASGPLSIKVEGRGRLADLTAGVFVSSPRLITGSGPLENARITLTASGRILEAPLSDETAGAAAVLAPELAGDLKLAVSESPGGPLDLSAAWAFSQGADGQTRRAEVRGLAASLAGLNLAGDLAADLGGPSPALDGALAGRIDDWSRLAALIGQPLSGGPLTMTVNLASAQGRQWAEADLKSPGLKLAGEGAEEALNLGPVAGLFRADDLFGQADLSADLTIGPGRAGPAAWGGARVAAQGERGLGRFSVAANSVALGAFGGSPGEGLNVEGTYDLMEPALQISRLDFNLAGSSLRLNQPLPLALGGGASFGPLSVSLSPGGSLTAAVDLTPGQMALEANLSSLPFSFFQPFVGAETPLPEGSVRSLSANFHQGPEGLRGTARLEAGLTYQGLSPSLSLTADLSGGPNPDVTVEGTISGGSGWDSGGRLAARIPLTSPADGGFPAPDMTGPLTGTVEWEGPISPLWALANQPDRLVRGMARISAEASGALANPEISGSAYLAGGRFEDTILGLLVTDINLEAHSAPEALLTAVVSAGDSRGGALALTGNINEGPEGLELTAQGRLGRWNPFQRDDLTAFLSGDLSAQGPLAEPAVTADLTVDRGELDLKVLMANQAITTLNISVDGETTAILSGPRLNVKVSVPNQFFIRGYGLDSEWEGDVTVSGYSSSPSLSGRLEPVRGYFELFSREFEFTDGNITFIGGTNPNLNLELTNNGPAITAIIRIGGTASRPTLHMTSQPPLPEEEVLAQVLFGKNASSLSRFEAIQLASSLRELTNFGSGGFSFDPVGSVRRSLGLDVLRVGSGDNTNERAVSDLTGTMAQDVTGPAAAQEAGVGGTTVEAGKYISDNVYVGVEHSPSGGSAFRLEMELSPMISLEARTSTESSQVGIGWKKDY